MALAWRVWNSFPQARPGSLHFGIPSPIPGTAKQQIFPAGLETSTGRRFQVFAINCAHLGCPVRWFPQSNLFMCPCHGGVYYSDGSHAAGPPPRGLFQYHYKIEDGKLFIKGGEMPTTGSPTANINGVRPPCA